MAYLVSDIIVSAMQFIAALSQGEIPNADEQTYCFNILNDLIDRWNSDRENLISTQIITLALASAKRNWTIGVGASDFNQARPIFIQNANSIVGGLRRPLRIVNAAQYSVILDPTTPQSAAPEILYPDYAYPVSTLYFYPLPSGSPSVELFTWVQLSQFATTSDPVALPPAYIEALKMELAIRLSPGFGRQVQPTLIALAEGAKSDMRRLNRGNWELINQAIGSGSGIALPPMAPPAAPAGPGA